MDNISKEKAVKFAFTLAETLVTLTIVGVLMALLLRSINRVNPDKDKILFIKSYHAVETVIADVVNDPTRYDPTFYTDQERANKIADEGANSMSSDFRDKPLDTARVNIPGRGNVTLTQDNAICYFLADQINTIGDVNCDNNNGVRVNGTNVTGVNFKSSTGVCFDNFNGVDNNGFKDSIIDPTCGGPASGYAINIYRDGKMSVPETNATAGNQAKAFEWINNQSKMN